LKKPVPGPSLDTLKRAFPNGIPGIKDSDKSLPDDTPYKKSRSRVIAQKERRVDESPFIPHVRYFKLNPEQRNYEFALAWSKIMRIHFPAFRMNIAWKKALSGIVSFRNSENFRNMMRNARVEADMLSARYEDYMTGIAEYYFERNASNGRELSPRPAHLAGETHVDAAKDYIEQGLKGRILITLQDIEYSGNADFLLAQNFDAAGADQKALINIFLQDVVFPELERSSFLTGHELRDLISYSIDYRLIPKQWAEGFGEHHRLDKLRRYNYEKPSKFTATTIFRMVQE